jgi:hypothetical protein
MVMSTSGMPETPSSISISLLDKPVPNLRPNRHQITIKSPSNPTHPPNSRLPDCITKYHLLNPRQPRAKQRNQIHSRRRKFTTAT